MNDAPQQPVSWVAVIGGIITALIAGSILGFFGGAVGISVNQSFGWLLGPAGVAIATFLLYVVSKRSSDSFARGIVIGGCIAVLLAGTCAYVLKGL